MWHGKEDYDHFKRPPLFGISAGQYSPYFVHYVDVCSFIILGDKI